MAPKAPVTITIVSPQAVRALVSAGDTLYAGGAGVYKAVAGAKLRLTQLGGKTFDKLTIEDLDAHAGVLCVGGDGLWVSTNGTTFTSCKIPKGIDLSAWASEAKGVGFDPQGFVYAGGEYLLAGKPEKPLERLMDLGEDARVRFIASTAFGALIGTFAGTLWIGNGGKVRKTTLRAGGFLGNATVTPAGTLVIVGHGKKWSAKAFRSVNQAKTFQPVKLPAKCAPLDAVACLPDGRVIAGGEGGTLLISTDDGASFKKLEAPDTGKKMLTTNQAGAFKTMCAHAGAVYAGGPVQSIVRIA